ncbi:MAG: DUF423 domain-containing protein [Alphaproteobacteria bacterium]|nr:DUF423 domain-containing protein [Alphaproteobacteria bacterium]
MTSTEQPVPAGPPGAPVRGLRIAAGLAGFTAVAAGAFGAHALSGVLDAAGRSAWQTGVLYHLVHAVALLAIVSPPRHPRRALRLAGACFLGGIMLFSGSLYALALGGPDLLGPVTPLGGLAFLAGWALVALAGLPPRSR